MRYSSERRSAMLLTEEEWNCLRGIAAFYMATDGGSPDSLDLCKRIMDTTASNGSEEEV